MHAELLDVLRCPLCSGRLRLERGPWLRTEGDEVRTGKLSCACNAYPVVDGIPYLRPGRRGEEALWLLEEGAARRALLRLLGVGKRGRAKFRLLAAGGRPGAFRDALALLAPEGEAVYFLYRFSDPTFLSGRAVLRALAAEPACWSGPVLDVGGGVGHFTRLLCGLAGRQPVVLAERDFWRAWLAKQYLAPACRPVCCTAHLPLPFAPDHWFSLVFCSDAFHFVRAKALLAGEMGRLLRPDGLLLLAHLHNGLCENPSPGWPLPPAEYRRLFAGLPARLLPERAVLDALCERRPLDLAAEWPDRELEREPALLLLASRRAELFKVYPAAAGPDGRGEGWAVNPLYAPEAGEGGGAWRLRFPSPEYEEEFAACKRYLPERLTLSERDLDDLRRGRLDGRLRDYAEAGALLDLPAGYW